MATSPRYWHEDIAEVPRGWKVRTKSEPGGTKVRIAFPPGRRRKGSGKLISILHPMNERNPRHSIGKARLEAEGGGLFGGKAKEYWETDVLGKKYRVRKTKKQRQHRLPVHVDVDTVTGEVTANPKTHKVKTREQVRKMQQKAVRFLRDVVKDRDKADEIEAMSLEDYAAKKHVTLSNPGHPSREAGPYRRGRGWRVLHRKIESAARKAKVNVRYEIGPGGTPYYVIDGHALSGPEALEELENRRLNPGRMQSWKRYKEDGIRLHKTYDGWSYEVFEPGNVVAVRIQEGFRTRRDAIEDAEAFIDSRRVNPGGAHACKSYRDKCVPASEMAYVGDPRHPTTWALRIDNASHIRDAMARFSHTRKIPRKYRRAVAEELHKAARKFGINDKHFAAKYLGKKNPESEEAQAENLYETFHQEPPSEVLEFDQEIYRPKDYAVLGKLVELRLRDLGLMLDFENEDVLLASNAAGTQLYFIGGNQDLRDVISEAGNKVDQTKDFIDLGEIDGVVYRARKEFTHYEETDWDHKLGEHGHRRPVLMYDKLNRQMYVVGGEYQVKYEGIIN